MNDGEGTPARSPDDPRRIRSLAVHTDDLVTALEARERGRRPAVLRVTPPFAGRMRARLHVASDGDEAEDDHLHLSPRSFLEDPPEFPSVDETEDRLRERGEYSIERHRQVHADAVERWREAVRKRRREAVSVELTGGPHEMAVSYLG